MKHRSLLPAYLLFITLLFCAGCQNKNNDTRTTSQETKGEFGKPFSDMGKVLTEKDEAKQTDAIKKANAIEEGFPQPIANQFLAFRHLVETDNKQAIAKLIPYPLKRSNELLQNEEDFINYYENIFDESLKKKIKEINIGQKDFIVKSDHYGILSGLIWFGRHSGEITSLRYQSEMEKNMSELKDNSIKERDHESIQGWEKVIVRCETENYTIYILQYPKFELSYVSWNKPKTSSDKPDLKLTGGEIKYKGTMGGASYTFKNGIWSYAIDERRMGPEGTNGYFLQVFKNGELVKEEKAKKIFE